MGFFCLFFSFRKYKSYDDPDLEGRKQEVKAKKFFPRRPPGPQLDFATRLGIHKFTRAVDFFKLFFTIEIIKNICLYTNLYSEDHPKESYNQVSYKVTEEDFYKYVGLLIYMGIVKLNRLWKYWSKSSLYNLTLPRLTMSLKRFKFISANIHVVDHRAEDKDEGRLKKVSYLMDHFKRVCKSLYQPSQNMSVDERMVKSKNRSGIRQFIKNKPVRFGIKLWVLAEAGTGYTYDFDVYTGGKSDEMGGDKKKEKGKKKGKGKKKEKGKGLGYKVVTSLCQSLQNQGYHVYFDNFFTSGPLLDDLLNDLGIYACGTTMSNRTGYPTEFKSSDKEWNKMSERGDMRWFRDGSRVVIQWKDNKLLTVMSTIHRADAKDKCKRRVKNKKTKEWEICDDIKRPKAVTHYNKFMGGVDLSDQLIGKYDVLKKVDRWWKTLFFHTVDIAIVNSYVMFNAVRNLHDHVDLKRPKSYDHLAFREELILQLTGVDNSMDEDEDEETDEEQPDCEGLHPCDYSTKVRESGDGINYSLCWFSEKKERKCKSHCKTCERNFCRNSKRDCMTKVHSKDFKVILQKILSAKRRGKKTGQ